MERRINGRGGGSKGRRDSKGGGEKEWESDIKHQGANWANSPAYSFFFGDYLSPFSPILLTSSFLLSFSRSHPFLFSPPIPLISSKSSYISSSSSSSQSLPTLTKKIRLTLMNRWREEGSDCIEGARERLDQRFLDQRLFTQDSPMWSCQSVFLPFFSAEAKLLGIRIIWMFFYSFSYSGKVGGELLLFVVFPHDLTAYSVRKDERRRGRDDTQDHKERLESTAYE